MRSKISPLSWECGESAPCLCKWLNGRASKESRPDAALHQVEQELNQPEKGGETFRETAASNPASDGLVGTCADLMSSVPSCEWNRYNIQYALAVSKQRGVKRTLEPLDTEEVTDASDEDSLHLLREAADEEEEGMLV